MAIPLTINGATFEYPQDFDENWGVDATGWAQAVTNGMLQLAGGNFPLTADVNFGPNFGLLSKYFETRSANPATAGTVRLSSNDAGIGWRNNANSNNLILTTNSADSLTWSSSLTLGNGSALNLRDAGGSHTIAVQTPTVSANYSITLPPNSGSSGQVLRTDGTGITTWVNAAGGGTVNSGTATQIAYYATSSSTLSGTPTLNYVASAGSTLLEITDSSSSGVLLTTGSVEVGIETTTTQFKIVDVATPRNVLIYDPSANTVAVIPPILLSDGTGSSPSLSFSSDTNTGVYRVGADTLGFATAGTGWWEVSSTGILSPIVAGPIIINNDGTAGAPSYTFADTDTGLYHVGSNIAGITAGGTLSASFTSTAVDVNSHKVTSLAAGTTATDGANFGQLKVDLLSSQTVSGVSTVTVSGLAGASYNSYRLIFNNVTTTTGAIPGTALRMTISTGGVFITTGYNFSFSSTTGSATTVTTATAAGFWSFNNGNLDSTGPSSDGEFEILGVSSTGTTKAVLGRNFTQSSSGVFAAQGSGNVTTPAAVVDGVKITASAGNISGTFVLYGLRNS